MNPHDGARPARTTLARFLAQERERADEARGLHAVIVDVAHACRLIARAARRGALAAAGDFPHRSEAPGTLEAALQEVLRRADACGTGLAGVLSETMISPCALPPKGTASGYLLAINRLDAPADFDVNLSAGTLFAVLRAPDARAATAADFLQPGSRLVAAGYALYGPATAFVISLGAGVHGFTLEPARGEFLLTHPNLRIPGVARAPALDAPGGRNYGAPPRAGLVAETHRVLLRGGACRYAGSFRGAAPASGPRLLHEAAPVAFLVEQAGGRASTGRERVLDLVPDQLHRRTGFVFGAAADVERLERHHHDHLSHGSEAPLFNMRGLFRPSL